MGLDADAPLAAMIAHIGRIYLDGDRKDQLTLHQPPQSIDVIENLMWVERISVRRSFLGYDASGLGHRCARRRGERNHRQAHHTRPPNGHRWPSHGSRMSTTANHKH